MTTDVLPTPEGIKIDLTRETYGSLTVQGYAGKRGRKHYWVCKCVCGTVKSKIGSDLRSKRTKIKSCGCLKSQTISAARTTHGCSYSTGRTREYSIWSGMRYRCYNQKYSKFYNYGGRGIKVCKRWYSFENFLADMGPCPVGLTLDRKRNSGDYTPSNCRWATRSEQNLNRRRWKNKKSWKYNRILTKDEIRQRARAHSVVYRAVKAGRLVKPLVCQKEGCVSSVRIQAHHHQGYDNENQLNVFWLCEKHHRKSEGKMVLQQQFGGGG